MRALFTLIGLLAVIVPAAYGDDSPYRIQPGDVLDVTVSPQTGYGRVITVQPDGKVSYPVAGELPAAGKTLPEFSRALSAGLEKELNNARVTVSLQTSAPRPAAQITVLGAVRAPGLYNLRAGWRITEALAAAGGPAPNADLRRITISGKDRTVRTSNLIPGPDGAQQNNPLIKEGDLVLVLEGEPPRAPSITVLGAVRAPGLFPLQGGWRLTEALAAAGGPLPPADLGRISVTHSDRTVRVADLIPGMDGTRRDNWEVKDGDLILVLELRRERTTVTVLGEVARPGVYEIQPDTSLLEALTLAGGPTPKAYLQKISFGRLGQQGIKYLDLQAILRGGPEGDNLKLLPGDTLILHENLRRAVVIGEVVKQGEVSLEGGETVLDLLIRSGGPSGSADLSKATILRRGKDGKPESLPVDLRKLTKGKEEPLLVASGDLLFVPPRDAKRRTGLSEYLSPLSLIFGLFGGF
jgi:protein involved in polysaccharide export with SLBB domain